MTDPPVQTQPSDDALALARLALAYDIADLAPGEREHLLDVVRDTLGCILAGSRLPEARGAAALALADGRGVAGLIGTAGSTSSAMAALVNATAGVSLELDEGSQFAVNHPAIHILPPALAVAQEARASGPALLGAVLAGYEIAARVGAATRLRDAVHPFGTHGVVGGAAAAARLLGFDAVQTARAIEVAAGLCVASSQMAANAGASSRNLCTGFTAHNAVMAAKMVQAGFCGEPGALTSVFGKILGSRFDIPAALADGPLFITRNYFKLYACSRWNHAPIEAAATLMAGGLDPHQIAAVQVWTFDPATRLAFTRIANGYAAKHSIPFNVAARLLYGRNDMEVYSDAMALAPAILDLMAKITVEEDPALTALLPQVRAARVRVRLRSGEVLIGESRHPRGGFDNPLTRAELIAKFEGLAARALTPAGIARVLRAVERLPEADDIDGLSAALASGAD
jgi:2-methylcitrate dehydratase PrpD